MEQLILKTGAGNALTKQIRNRTLSFYTDLPVTLRTCCRKRERICRICSSLFLQAFVPQSAFELHAAIKGSLAWNDYQSHLT